MTVLRAALLWMICFGPVANIPGAEKRAPLLNAHAHNDYLHARPLADALSHGFWSVEADIWLTNGMLLVGHDLEDTARDKTLQRLYLDPLRAFMKTNAVPPGTPPFTLLIDIKSNAELTYAALRDVLKNYEDILTRFESNRIHTKAVIAIISGNRPQATLRAEPVRLVAIDGRLPDLESNPPVALVPLVSDDWTKHFKWRGTGPLPEDERMKLRDLAVRARTQGRRLRLWATPDNPAGWKELRDGGVDLIGTDNLSELEGFLRKSGRQEP